MKQVIRLYPRRWRQRYGAEMISLVARQRTTLAGIVDLLRGAFEARLRVGNGLVYVPMIGFRPVGTRTLLGDATTEQNRTRLTVLAVAASRERTDVVVEWQREPDAPACRPGHYLAAPGASPDPASAAILTGGLTIRAESIAPGAYGAGMYGTHAIHTLSFPAIDSAQASVDLRLNEGDREFRVPMALTPAVIRARAVVSAAQCAGITIRATSTAWHGDELIIAIKAEAALSIRQVAAPPPAQTPFRSITQEVRLARAKEMQRVMGRLSEPIMLEDAHGGVTEELRRIFEHRSQSLRGEPSVHRFSVVFAAPAAEVDDVTVVVPFVEVSDLGPAATVDLRMLPADVELGPNRLRVVSADPYGSETKVVLELRPSDLGRGFVQPASFLGRGGNYSWGRGPGEQIWFAATVGEPPIVTFRGVVWRIEGPWRLRVPLT
jgi:hypothetical protein